MAIRKQTIYDQPTHDAFSVLTLPQLCNSHQSFEINAVHFVAHELSLSVLSQRPVENKLHTHRGDLGSMGGGYLEPDVEIT